MYYFDPSGLSAVYWPLSVVFIPQSSILTAQSSRMTPQSTSSLLGRLVQSTDNSVVYRNPSLPSVQSIDPSIMQSVLTHPCSLLLYWPFRAVYWPFRAVYWTPQSSLLDPPEQSTDPVEQSIDHILYYSSVLVSPQSSLCYKPIRAVLFWPNSCRYKQFIDREADYWVLRAVWSLVLLTHESSPLTLDS